MGYYELLNLGTNFLVRYIEAVHLVYFRWLPPQELPEDTVEGG